MTLVPPREQWARSSDSRPLSGALGLHAEDIGEGWARFRVDAVEASADGDGSVHSFAITVAADLCLLAAASTTIDREREDLNGTAEMNLTYVRSPRSGALVTGRVLHRAPHLAIVDLEVRERSGELVAKGRGSYSVRPLEPGAER